ncbi:MAG TPA: hypothetical protein P5290_00855 [Candidatus Methanomethylicus sp.]|nr:hypothetical protein [Candidatus Methanomethylicus sp.]
MPPRKKESYTKRKIFAIFIIVALLASYGTYFFISLNSAYTPPSPTSFVYEDWMWFLPAGTLQFRFLNITDLLQFEGLFINETILSIDSPSITVNLTELSFGIDMVAPSSGLVAILGISQEAQDRVASILSQSNATTLTINNVTLYKTSASKGSSMSSAWMGIFNDSLIYSEGDSVAIAAIQDVLGAAGNNFFGNDDYKVGYLIINSQRCYVISYYLEEANSYKVLSDMRGAYGTSAITKHEVYFITNSSDLSSTYSKIKEDLLFGAVSVARGDDFVVATFSYPISELRSVLSN